MDLRQIPLNQIKGIGDKTAKGLTKLGLFSVRDLFWYAPRTYLKYPEIKSIHTVAEGETVAILGKVDSNLHENRNARMPVTTFTVHDRTGVIQMVFFRQTYLRSIFKAGMEFVFYGTVKRFGNTLKMEMPEYYKYEEYKRKLTALQPVYSLTKGFTSKSIQKYIQTAMNEFFPLADPLSNEEFTKYDFPSLSVALRDFHFPTDQEVFLKARKRLVFDEFCSFLEAIEESKAENTSLPTDYVINDFNLSDKYEHSIPFALTGSQKEAINDIHKDYASGFAMRRLIQGDVGSGKTMVAFLAMTDTVSAGFQCAMMAPTEVLAKQHFEKLCADNEKYNLGLHPELLTGSLSAAKKRAAYERLASGESDCIIGTHAVFQEKVNFRNLALVITDEQHRFGVKQRETLSEKGRAPHVLVMSATPIPRTLTMTLYADLSVTVMKDLPNKRLPIKSCIIGADLRNNAFNFIEQEVKAGHQAYIICPMVEENEDSSLENVTDYPKRLIAKFGDRITYSILHGRMKPAEKTAVMEEFASGKVNVLISTTVVEVGVDVPNATVILIENAERFGLAQLHQLRGRVGRGDAQSYCIFLDGTGKGESNERLNVLKNSNDGFFIAEEDLRLRGPGDLDGLRQSGEMNFAIADIIQDYSILMMAKEFVSEKRS